MDKRPPDDTPTLILKAASDPARHPDPFGAAWGPDHRDNSDAVWDQLQRRLQTRESVGGRRAGNPPDRSGADITSNCARPRCQRLITGLPNSAWSGISGLVPSGRLLRN